MSDEVKIIGREEVIAKLTARKTETLAAILRAQRINGADLSAYVKTSKLSGQALNVRTGRLRRSIHDELRQSSSDVTAAVGTNVEYAAAHEFGFHGTVEVRAHLRKLTMVFGKPVAARQISVSAHPMKMNIAEKSFLRSSLAERKDIMLNRLRNAMGVA